jgi:hypothetical protein
MHRLLVHAANGNPGRPADDSLHAALLDRLQQQERRIARLERELAAERKLRRIDRQQLLEVLADQREQHEGMPGLLAEIREMWTRPILQERDQLRLRGRQKDAARLEQGRQIDECRRTKVKWSIICRQFKVRLSTAKRLRKAWLSHQEQGQE